eukprot:GGOE01024356.1.p1 GENE.GGOE01024356.1~~GGOE01024356.1.p1  ORF type:complete len:166 (+),score=60.94 GGOE01024356.1:559-1056(+)
MPSALAWTIGWGFYAAWIMKETWNLRSSSVGWTPITLMEAYKTKERYLRSKAMMERYNEELDAVNDSNITEEDAAKFELAKATPSISIWEQFRSNPYWKTVEEEISENVRKTMLEKHPDYALLLDAVNKGSYSKLWHLPGPWMNEHYNDGLHGRFLGWTPKAAHH